MGLSEFLTGWTILILWISCCHVCANAPLTATWNCYINYKSGYVGLSFFHLMPLLNAWLIVKIPAWVFSIGITFVDADLNWLNWFHFLILEGGLLVILINCMILLSPFLDFARMTMWTVSFLAQLVSGILWIFFPLTYDLNSFKSRINRYLLIPSF